MTQTTDARTATATVSDTIDRLSLEQALIDVEVANARVIDLTARLAESHAEAQQLRQQVLDAASAPSGNPFHRVRALVAGPIKAVARRVLPPGVRTRIRSALG